MIFNARNPKWLNEAETQLSVEVQSDGGEWLLLVTGPGNSVPEEAMLYNFCVNGLLGGIQDFISVEDAEIS
jgi:hypothetical protein